MKKFSVKRESYNPPRIAKVLFLISVAFLAGAAIMVVELAANRILAPWFGNSLYTWTSLIGVILIALSVGYYLGGWLVDRNPAYSILATLLLLSALFVAAIPLLKGLFENFFEGDDVIYGSLAASLVLFAIPGALLASISPFCVRLISKTADDRNIGISAGTISTASALGSVFGVFIAGFYLIPSFRISWIFIITAFLLLLLSAVVVALFYGRNCSPPYLGSFLLTAVVGYLAAGGLPQSEKSPSLLYEKTSFYHRIRVIEEKRGGEPLKLLTLDTTVEGAQYEDSREIPIAYQRFWELGGALAGEAKRAAFLGGGAFTMPQALLDKYGDDVKVHAVEIDPYVIETARRFFRLNDYPALNTVADDARRFLQKSDGRLDLIFGDVYNGVHYIPFHLVTREFFSLAKERLSENGVFMMNLISGVIGEKSLFFGAICKTLQSSFPHIYLFQAEPIHPAKPQNLVIVASKKELSRKFEELKKDDANPQIKKMLSRFVSPDRYDCSAAPLLTDDYNPVEFLVSRYTESAK
ncbi:MAG: fused MFS/spermidine synthase [Myxococcota bacterium]